MTNLESESESMHQLPQAGKEEWGAGVCGRWTARGACWDHARAKGPAFD